MPSKNPRLTLTLDPEIAFVLRRLSQLTGESQAALVSELLEGNKLAFVRLIRSLERVGRERADLAGRYSEDFERSQALLQAHLDEMLDEHDRDLLVRKARHERIPVDQDVVKRRKARLAPVVGPEHARGGPRSAGGASGERKGTETGASPASTRSVTPTY